MTRSERTAPAGVLAWLCGDHADHARYVDMHARFRSSWVFGVAVGGTTLVVSWWDAGG